MIRRSVVPVILALAPASCRTPPFDRPEAPAPHAVAAVPEARVHSNILRADYAGSSACAECHAEIARAFEASPMHRMTRLSAGADVRAPFDGRTVTVLEDSATLSEENGERLFAVHSARFGDHRYRVTKVIGGRYREDFAGVEIGAPEDPGGAKNELILPLSWIYADRSFRLKGYSVMVRERPGLRAGGVWNQTCILCHNTAPAMIGLLGAIFGPGAPSYQGEIVDPLLPESRQWTIAVTDPALLLRALDEEIPSRTGGSSADLKTRLLGAIRTTHQRFDAGGLVEIGIGCESCHGGSKEHVEDPRRLPSFALISPFLAAGPADGHPPKPAELVNRACARCHQVLFTRYPYTWEGGRRARRDHPGGPAPGGSSISSGEARDFLLGGCAGELACTRCHDPHAEDREERLAALATPAGNPICTSCHAAYAEAEALRKHAHHDPNGAGGSCVACHLPKKNMGLGYTLTRYHRIGSPTDPERVEHDRPLECALCHRDKTTSALIEAMERSWGRRYDRKKLEALYGDLDKRPLEQTLERGLPHEQAVAIALLDDPARLAEQAAHPYPLLRFWAAARQKELSEARLIPPARENLGTR